MQEIHNSLSKSKGQPAAKQPDQSSVDTEQLYAQEKPRRTAGLRLFDIGLYPLLANFSVFAISVVFTFLTARGGDKKDGKNIYGGVGKFFHSRGVLVEGKLQDMGMSAKNAEMTKVVAFSFIDGSIMAFPIKWFEDRREKIAYWIDKKLGTVPEDMKPYEAEPKQSWWSVLGGRFVTAGIVVPTAMLLSKKVAYRPIRNDLDPLRETNPYRTIFGSPEHKANTSLNDIAFNDASEQFGRKSPRMRKWFERVIEKVTGVKASEDIWVSEIKDDVLREGFHNHGDKAYSTLTRMTFFEGFYTSVCTVGGYIGSRMIAAFLGNRADKKTAAKKQDEKAVEVLAAEPAKPVITPTKIEIPLEPKAPEGRVHTQALEASRLSSQEHVHALQGI